MTQKQFNLELFKRMPPNEYTYDERGNLLTLKKSDGYWSEYTRDKKGKVLSYKNSYGYWYEYTYDENGRELTFKDSHGVDAVYFFYGNEYNLAYDNNAKKYKAGCQYLTYKQCGKYYKENKDEYEDSHDFIEAIRNHQKTLTESE